MGQKDIGHQSLKKYIFEIVCLHALFLQAQSHIQLMYALTMLHTYIWVVEL